MIKSIIGFFTDYSDIWHLIARIALVLCVSAIVFLVVHYSRKRNINWLVYIEFTVLLLLFTLAFADIPNFKVYIYAVLFLMAVADVTIFAQDISRDLFRISWKKRLHTSSNLDREDLGKTIEYIVRACQNLSKIDTGALIVISDNMNQSILESGTYINAKVSSDLLETIFFPKTPLHDGAVVICADEIVAAACYLPISQNLDLPREFGTRHRAAIGITYDNPTATAIVVSEETGIMSAMFDGRIKRYLDSEQLTKILEHAFGLLTAEESQRLWGGKQ